MVSLKYTSSLRRTLEMPLINCERDFQWSWSDRYILVAGTATNQEPKFKITDTKFFVSDVTLSTKDN